MSNSLKTLLPRSLFTLTLAVVMITAVAQSTSEYKDQMYGYDPLLYNGRVYSFYTLPGTDGTQFLNNEFDTKGTIIIRGVTFNNLTINYDVYNQQLILKYNDVLGTTKFVDISKAWLESFILGGNSFILFTITDSTKRIYQIIGSGINKVMYYYTKDLAIDNMGTAAGHFFTGATKAMYVLYNNQLISYKNNTGFVKIFDPSHQELIKTYIRRHSINVRKSNDMIITDLINYCNTLAGS